MDTEQTLFSFGPFGVSVWDGPFGIFKWHWENVFVIEITDRCLRGRRKWRLLSFPRPRGGAPFEIPHASVTSVQLMPHPSPLSLMKVMTITYRDAQGPRVRSIAAYTASAERAFSILQRFVSAAGV